MKVVFDFRAEVRLNNFMRSLSNKTHQDWSGFNHFGTGGAVYFSI